MLRWAQRFNLFVLTLLVFAIPIEHKYDKIFRHLTLVPEGTLLRGFDKKIFFYLSDLAAILLFAVALWAIKIPFRRLLLDHGAPLLWALFACAATSIFFSPFWNYPVAYTRLLQLLTPILLFSVLSHTTTPQKTVQCLFIALLVAALFQSAIAIAQYFLQSPIGLSLLNEPKMATASFSSVGGHRWWLDGLFSRISNTGMVLRPSGTFVHANVLGSFLTLSILILYSLIASTPKKSLRNLLALLLFVLLFALTITYSRSAIFGWAIGTLIWFAYSIYRRGLREMLFDRNIRFLSTALLILVTASAALFHKQFLHRGGVVNYNYLTQASDSIRIEANKVALQLIWQNPLLGAGYQQFCQAGAQAFPSAASPDLVHNIYLLIAAETGIFSLLAFLSFIALLLRTALLSPYSPELASLFSILIAFLFIGGCDFPPIQLQQGRLMLFCTAGLIMAERYRLQRTVEQKVSLL